MRDSGRPASPREIGRIHIGSAQGARPLIKLLVHAGIVTVLVSNGCGIADKLARFYPEESGEDARVVATQTGCMLAHIQDAAIHKRSGLAERQPP